MFSLNESLNYYLYPHYIPMGKGIEALSELIRSCTSANLLSGDVYLFVNKGRNVIKALRWDTDGFILYQKRLETGTFEIPRFKPGEGLYKLDWKIFFLIMKGIPLRSISYRKRFRL